MSLDRFVADNNCASSIQSRSDDAGRADGLCLATVSGTIHVALDCFEVLGFAFRNRQP